MITPIVYLNGEWLPQDQARISVLDRGFLFGDGVYEVIPVYQGQPFLGAAHLQRLAKSLQALGLAMPLEEAQWQVIFRELIQRNMALYGSNQTLYLQITRGATPERYHAFPSTPTPTIFAQAMPAKTLPYTTLSQGKIAITLPDTRWQYSYIKSTALLANVLLYQAACEAGADEAILLREGEVVEGSTSNVFIVRNGELLTPPLAPYILAGITRALLLELAYMRQLPAREVVITESMLRQADEVWITSSTREIYPIVQLDNQPVGEGVAGPVWCRMIEYYYQYIQQYTQCRATENPVS